MIQTMICIWWVIFIISIAATAWVGVEAWKAGGKTEGYEFFGYAAGFVSCAGMALLAAATICAIGLI